jgi:hypothetical protein
MKLLLVLELDAKTERKAQQRLDDFRFTVCPSANFGLTISRARQADIRESGVLEQVPRIGPVPTGVMIKPW